MKPIKRTYHLSEKAVKHLEHLNRMTGLKYSTIIERLILGLSVGAARREP